MNKLKRLFSPRALAATAGSALLLHGAVTALATNCRTVSAGPVPPGPCQRTCFDFTGQFYWCCTYTETCGPYAQGCNPPLAFGCGQCCH
jgi:hypothetical protein